MTTLQVENDNQEICADSKEVTHLCVTLREQEGVMVGSSLFTIRKIGAKGLKTVMVQINAPRDERIVRQKRT